MLYTHFMKVYSVSRQTFWLVFGLILIIPLSKNWWLMSTGETTRVTVGPFEHYTEYNRLGGHHLRGGNLMEFQAGGKTLAFYGPKNYEMREGRQVRIWYDPEDPSRHVVFTFVGLYNSGGGMLSLGLLILWGAFYLSFNNPGKQKIRPK